MIKCVVGVVLFGLMVQVVIVLIEFVYIVSDLLKFFEVVYYVYKWDDNLGFVKVLFEELFFGFYLLIY